jgi:hypothetical protein
LYQHPLPLIDRFLNEVEDLVCNHIAPIQNSFIANVIPPVRQVRNTDGFPIVVKRAGTAIDNSGNFVFHEELKVLGRVTIADE